MKKERICFILALLTLLSFLTACSEKNGKKPETDRTSDDASATASPVITEEDTLYDENGYERDFLGDFNFDRDFTIFYWDDAPYVEFNTESESGATVADANYRRNLKVAERCGVTLQYITEPGSSAKRNSFVTKLKALVGSDDNSIDLVGAYSMAAGIAATSGLYLDLNTGENFEWDKPWWPASLRTLSTINGKLYFASGDISLNNITSMFAVFFNKDLLTSRSLEDPYQLFSDRKWTLDKMWEMSKNLYADTNNDGKVNVGDSFGMLVQKTSLDAFMQASGITFLTNDNHTLELNEDFLGERGNSVIEKLSSIIHDSTAAYLIYTDSSKEGRESFASGEVLFWTDSVVAAPQFNSGSLSYGMVPVPLITEGQEKYYTPMAFGITFFSVPYTEKDMSCASAVMEILASESYRTTSPALYEQDLKCRYSQDANAAAMFDVIRANVIYDHGRVFSESFGHPYNTLRKVVNEGTSWITAMKGQENPWRIQLAKVLESIG